MTDAEFKESEDSARVCLAVAVLPSLGCVVCCPDLAAFPPKVLWAKLCSMRRRVLIYGYGGGYNSRGDWHVFE